MAKNVRENLRHEPAASPTGALAVYGHRTARQSMYGCNNFETNCLGVVYRTRRQVNSFQYTSGGTAQRLTKFRFDGEDQMLQKLVPYAQCVTKQRLLQKAGGTAELFSADGAGHGFFNAAPWYESTVSRMHGFLDRVLRPSR